jgi:hypothetical protein
LALLGVAFGALTMPLALEATLALLAHAFLAVTRAQASGPERAKGNAAA